jgi:hypothetical protein
MYLTTYFVFQSFTRYIEIENSNNIKLSFLFTDQNHLWNRMQSVLFQGIEIFPFLNVYCQDCILHPEITFSWDISLSIIYIGCLDAKHTMTYPGCYRTSFKKYISISMPWNKTLCILFQRWFWSVNKCNGRKK